MPKKLQDMTLDEITGVMGDAQPGSPRHGVMSAELARRQTVAQIGATRYMLWSVIAIAITSGLNALFAFLTWYAPHVPK
jgi:hypothetical protein